MGKKSRKAAGAGRGKLPYTAQGHLRGPWEKQAQPEYWIDEDSACPNKKLVSASEEGTNYVCECAPPCKFAIDQKQSDIEYYNAVVRR